VRGAIAAFIDLHAVCSVWRSLAFVAPLPLKLSTYIQVPQSPGPSAWSKGPSTARLFLRACLNMCACVLKTEYVFDAPV
jgi:hypothetical protein